MKKVELIKRLFTNEEIIAIDNRNRELEEENKKLKEEIRFLEECLDRKEKLNKGYREEIDLLRKGNLPSPGYPYGGGPIFC